MASYDAVSRRGEWKALSDDLWLEILVHSEINELLMGLASCKRIHAVGHDNRLWRWMCCKAWHTKQPHHWSKLLEIEAGEAEDVDWRDTFKAAWRDSARTFLSAEELCDISWMASFHSRWEGMVKRQGFFLPTGIYHNNKGDAPQPWPRTCGRGQYTSADDPKLFAERESKRAIWRESVKEKGTEIERHQLMPYH
jgi:hypothetical protein